MLIEFVGCPNSGKTTTAAKIFDSLKESEIIAEFIPEEARRFIVSLRAKHNIPYNVVPKLTDEHQISILKRQLEIEINFSRYCNPSTVIICDSSPLNTLLYMSDEVRLGKEVKALIEFWDAELRPVIFYSKPIPENNYPVDSNRVHSKQESSEIDSKIPGVLETYASNKICVELDGGKNKRYSRAFIEAMSLLAKGA